MTEDKVKVTDQEHVSEKSSDEVAKENEDLESELNTTRKPKLEDIMAEKKKMREKKQEEDMAAVMLVEQQDRSVNLGVIGVGQCGSKIAEEFYARGYNAAVINTAMQDLKHIKIPERQKLFLDYSLGGAAKDLETGAAAAEQYQDEILKHIEENTEDCEILMLAVSGGGGSGSGSAETMVNLMSTTGKPIVVLFVLPLTTDDTIAKSNTIQTLSILSDMASKDIISSLVIVDNAKIESMFPGLSMAEFWKVANESIVEPLHLFNKLSSTASPYVSLDPMDFAKVWTSGDCALYGMMEVEDYLEDEAVAEAMVANLQTGLLSDSFDLRQTRSAGIIITGNKNVLEKVPAANLEYGFAMVGKICNDGTRVFRGVYEVPSKEDVLTVYSFFSGLGLPDGRVKELKEESDKYMKILENKEASRATSMNIDIGKTKTTSAADALHKKIKNKSSAMGKLTRNAKKVIDRRRR
jgi:cell division GTPase FtsZ